MKKIHFFTLCSILLLSQKASPMLDAMMDAEKKEVSNKPITDSPTADKRPTDNKVISLPKKSDEKKHAHKDPMVPKVPEMPHMNAQHTPKVKPDSTLMHHNKNAHSPKMHHAMPDHVQHDSNMHSKMSSIHSTGHSKIQETIDSMNVAMSHLKDVQKNIDDIKSAVEALLNTTVQ